MAGAFIYDPRRDSTKGQQENTITKKLSEYMQDNKEAGEVLIEIYDGQGVQLIAWLEQDLPELRGKWIPYVYRKYCASIPWEFKLGIEEGTLFTVLMEDAEFVKVHPGFKERVKSMLEARAKAKEEQEADEATGAELSDKKKSVMKKLKAAIAKKKEAKEDYSEEQGLLEELLGI